MGPPPLAASRSEGTSPSPWTLVAIDSHHKNHGEPRRGWARLEKYSAGGALTSRAPAHTRRGEPRAPARRTTAQGATATGATGGGQVCGRAPRLCRGRERPTPGSPHHRGSGRGERTACEERAAGDDRRGPATGRRNTRSEPGRDACQETRGVRHERSRATKHAA